MSIENTLTFAKVLISSNGRNHCEVTSDVYHKALEDLARANKRAGESLQQSYVRMSEQSEAGALLLKAVLWAPKPKQAPQDFANPEPPYRGPAQAEIDRIVDEFAARYNRTTAGRKLSRAQAFDRVYNDPANRELRDRLKRESAEASLRVQQQRSPIWRAEESFERPDWRLGRSPGSARM
jgi:hypothetical protein